MKDEMKTNPSCDFISRADAIEAIASAEPKDAEYHYYKHFAIKILSEIPSIEVEPSLKAIKRQIDEHWYLDKPSTEVIQTQVEKCDECIHKGTRKDKMTCKECASIEVEPRWNCTANFVAEQLERLKDMTDEERLKLLQKMFSPIEQKTGEWIPNHYGLWTCSECGLSVLVYAKENYCPNCGAKMYKGGEDE